MGATDFERNLVVDFQSAVDVRVMSNWVSDGNCCVSFHLYLEPLSFSFCLLLLAGLILMKSDASSQNPPIFVSFTLYSFMHLLVHYMIYYFYTVGWYHHRNSNECLHLMFKQATQRIGFKWFDLILNWTQRELTWVEYNFVTESASLICWINIHKDPPLVLALPVPLPLPLPPPPPPSLWPDNSTA